MLFTQNKCNTSPIIAQYINSIALLYNQPNTLASIVDKKGSILYLSDPMLQLNYEMQNTKSNNIFDNVFNNFNIYNHIVIDSCKVIEYFYIMQNSPTELSFYKCIKSPICNINEDPIAVMTIQHKLRLIDLENIDDSNYSYCFELKDYKLSDIEQLILFYASHHFSHGEIFQFITKHSEPELKIENFNYYCKKLRKKFKVDNMEELISNHNILKNRKFIPRRLIQNEIILLKSSNYRQKEQTREIGQTLQ